MSNFIRSSFYTVDPPIFATTNSEHHIASESVSISAAHVSINNAAVKAVPAGLFVAKVGNVNRFLPRSTVKTATSTSANTLQPVVPQVFIPGDVLYVIQPYATITITSVSATQTQTVTVSGYTATATATTSNTTITAQEVVTAINNTAGINQFVYALNLANVVYVFGKDGVSTYAISEGGTVTSTLSGAALAFNTTAIGTIQGYDYTTGTFTLAANATVALPIGAVVGVLVDEIYGLHNHSIDFTIYPNHTIALYTQSAACRIQHLPHFDDNIRNIFKGRIHFGYKF
ncbi:hypothetical protein [Scytonema sp. NUACC26]|uniref:hypothetical protein n=1 Tax=Scytonema sp. NUACC26 TaxID=3140176 RepID=UPI0034DBA571